MKKTFIKISLVCNIIIFIFTVGAAIIMFTGFKFMEGDLMLDVHGFGMLRFFTVQSNILMGIVALLFGIKEVEILKGRAKEIPLWLYDLKLVSTVAVTVTLLTVLCYLAPLMGDLGIFLKNSNLFFHLIIPVLSIITFVLFERTNIIKFKHTVLGIVPVSLYSLYYLVNVLCHIENGVVSPKYDWYWFVQGGLYQTFFVIPIMLFGTYVICVLLWFLNHKRNR